MLNFWSDLKITIRDSIVVSIPACHAGDRGSIPRLGAFFSILGYFKSKKYFLPGFNENFNVLLYRSFNDKTRKFSGETPKKSHQ